MPQDNPPAHFAPQHPLRDPVHEDVLRQDDLQLCQRILRKERAAFEQFFEVYFARLVRFCGSRVDDPAAVEDIVQVSLQKALHHLAGYRREASLFTWVCQICRHEIADWYRTRHRIERREVPLDDHLEVRAALESMSEGADSADATDVMDLQRSVQLTLDHLPDHYGRALEWKYVDGLSVQEIGTRLRLNSISTQSLLARARSAFRKRFLDLQQSIQAAS